MHPTLNIAVKAARRAGAIINRASLDLDRLQISRKGPRNYVTEVDRAAEEAIVEVLQAAYPDHSFLAEESGERPADRPSGKGAKMRWIIDPLDGTTNFIHGYPAYAISIALTQDDVPVQAVIYDPNRNELFTASRGAGAFMNDRRIRVSGHAGLADALLGERIGRSAGDAELRAPFQGMLASAGAVRRGGSSVLDLAYVAAGRLDGFCGYSLKPWDVAAGGLLILEAGGLVGDFGGDQGWLQSGHIIAATPKVFTRMLAGIQT